MNRQQMLQMQEMQRKMMKKKKRRNRIIIGIVFIFIFFVTFYLFNGAEPQEKSASDAFSSSSSSSDSSQSEEWAINHSRSQSRSRSHYAQGAFGSFYFPTFGRVERTTSESDSKGKIYRDVTKPQIKRYIQTLKNSGYTVSSERDLGDSYSIQLRNTNARLVVVASWYSSQGYTNIKVYAQ